MWTLESYAELPGGFPGKVVETAELAVQTLPALLELAEAGKLKVSAATGAPTAAGVRHLLAALPEGDYYATPDGARAIDTIRPFGWMRLLEAALLDRSARGRPVPEVLRTLWEAYLRTKNFDEFDRISAIAGWQRKTRVVTPVVPRRQKLAATLMSLPPGRWVQVDDFFSLILATDNDFLIAKDLSKLYVGGSQWYGNLDVQAAHLCLWEICQGRFALAFLMEYAATLGLIDVAYGPPEYARRDYYGLWGAEDTTSFSRYDGLAAIRLNGLGEYVTGLKPAYTPTLSKGPVCLRLDGVRIEADAPPPAVQRVLAMLGPELTVEGLAAHAQTLSLPQVEEFLKDHSGGPLPAPMQQVLAECRRRFPQLGDRGMVRLIEAEPGLLDRLLKEARLRKLVQRVGERFVTVAEADEPAVRKLLAAQGYPLGSLDVGSDWDDLERELMLAVGGEAP